MTTIPDFMTRDTAYWSNQFDIPPALQRTAKTLCWEYNQTRPDAADERRALLTQLLGTSTAQTFIEPTFHCDYGFNIYSHGLLVMNYNCSVLDTSPVHLGDGVFIAPNVCLACPGHAALADQRAAGIGYSAPITLEDNVWLGANVVVLGGVTIGAGSIIGAGSVVTRDIPAGVIAVGSPCKVVRPITEADRLTLPADHRLA
ncbi:sugar O-acetyltransferase [Lacticaseibacillus daqingensis]|uniref:sugar O-acetyltransferase n=1 Tax=Lacticaseibacillus daqingensis TaxID=2486014 RepID=UPI001CDC6FD8|nr:sugar O-acetyltransferase [Lacticaseibacillus daqingensis]